MPLCVYGSPNVAAFPDEQAFDPDLALSVDVRHHEFIDKGVKGPPGLRVVPPTAPVLEPDNPEADPATTGHGGYIPCRTRITKISRCTSTRLVVRRAWQLALTMGSREAITRRNAGRDWRS